MIPVCPRCGSTDVHSSHTKGAMDRVLRLLAFPPRRCSACGWRGYRPRPLFPSKHGSNPEMAAAKAPEPTTAPPEPEPEPKERSRHRRHRHRHHVKTKSVAWKIALLAVGLGAALGYVVLRMGG